jgi:pilus assembly protein CpaE
MEALKRILLVDENLDTREALRAILQALEGISLHVLEQTDAEALGAAAEVNPQVVVLNLHPASDEMLAFAGQIAQRLRDAVLVVTAESMNSDLIRRAMREGAREFLPQPFNAEDVKKALTSILELQKPSSRPQNHAGQVVTTFGAKGGVGATTLTTNLAVMLSGELNKEVIVLDLNMQFGNDALFLNLKSKFSVFDVVKNIDELDTDLLKKTLPRHATGVTLLPSPFRIEDAEGINGPQISRIIQMLRANYDWILIDSHPYFNEISIQALDEADRILLVSALDLPTIYNTKRCLELFQKMGYGREKALLVLNRYFSYEGADLPEMERLLDYPIFARIANQDFSSAISCINQGVPITLKMPGAKMSQAILEMTNQLDGRVNGKEHQPAAKTGLFTRWMK